MIKDYEIHIYVYKKELLIKVFINKFTFSIVIYFCKFCAWIKTLTVRFIKLVLWG